MSQKERDAFVAGAKFGWGIENRATRSTQIQVEALRRYPDEKPAQEPAEPFTYDWEHEAPWRWRCKGCETILSETHVTRMDHGVRQHPIIIRYHDGYEEEAWCGPVVFITDVKEGE
jgi:hypothetical protein